MSDQDEIFDITEDDIKNKLTECLTSKNKCGKTEFVFALINAIDIDLPHSDLLNYIEYADTITR